MAESYPTRCLEFETHTLEERIAELIEATPPGAAAVGYSMGGRLLLQAAVREPERFAALIVVGASAGIESLDERRARLMADRELADRIERQPIEQTVLDWEARPPFAAQSPRLVQAQRRGRLSHRPADLASLLRTAGQGATEPFWHQIPSLPMPLLALAGENDARYVEAAERLASLAPRGSAAVVPEAGHAAHLERPDFVADRVRELLGP